MMAIKLYDGTIIYAKEFHVANKAILIEDFKYLRENETPSYIDDPMTIHTDAIEVYFIVHKGEKVVNAKEISEGGDEPPASA